MGMVAYPILWYYRRYQKKLQASRVSFEGASSATFPTQKYKGFSWFIKGKNFRQVLQFFLFLNNFLANIGWTGVIAEVQTVV